MDIDLQPAAEVVARMLPGVVFVLIAIPEGGGDIIALSNTDHDSSMELGMNYVHGLMGAGELDFIEREKEN